MQFFRTFLLLIYLFIYYILYSMSNPTTGSPTITLFQLRSNYHILLNSQNIILYINYKKFFLITLVIKFYNKYFILFLYKIKYKVLLIINVCIINNIYYK